jgi:hypothetical protein
MAERGNLPPIGMPQVSLGDAEYRPEAHEASDRRGRGSAADDLPTLTLVTCSATTWSACPVPQVRSGLTSGTLARFDRVM